MIIFAIAEFMPAPTMEYIASVVIQRFAANNMQYRIAALTGFDALAKVIFRLIRKLYAVAITTAIMFAGAMSRPKMA